MGIRAHDGVLLVAHGTVTDLDDLPEFVANIRRGRPASPELVAKKLPRASLQYLSFGRAEGELVGPRHFRVRHHGIPRTLSSWLTACVEGFAPTALYIAGATNAVLTSRVVGPDGEKAGFALVELLHDLNWD